MRVSLARATFGRSLRIGRKSVRAAFLRATRIEEKMTQTGQSKVGPNGICMLHEPYMEQSRRVNKGWGSDAGDTMGELGSVRSGVKHEHISGMRQLNMLMKALDSVKRNMYALSPDQNTIVMLGIKAMITRIFPERELLQNLSFIMEYFDLEELFEDIIVQMRRRGGKTTTLSILLGIIPLCVQDGNSYVVASSLRVSLLARDVAHDVIKTLIRTEPEFQNATVKARDKQLLVKTPYGTESIVMALPGNQEIGATVQISILSHIPASIFISSLWFFYFFLLLSGRCYLRCTHTHTKHYIYVSKKSTCPELLISYHLPIYLVFFVNFESNRHLDLI